LTLCTCRGGW